MTPRTRAADAGDDDEPTQEPLPEQQTSPAENVGEPVQETSEPLNPTGAPNEEFSGAEPDASVRAVNEAGGEQVQAAFDEAEEKGYIGVSPDETPRENYTLQGQVRR